MSVPPETDKTALLALRALIESIAAFASALLGAYYGTLLRYRAEFKDMPSRLAREFATSYEQERGKRLATKEDIQNVIEQVKAVTKEAELIKAQIGIDVWNHQTILNWKREALGLLLRSAHDVEDSLIELVSRERSVESQLEETPVSEATALKWRSEVQQRADEFVASQNRLAQSIAEAQIFMDSVVSIRTLYARVTTLKIVGTRRIDAADSAEALQIVRKVVNAVVLLARRELGIES